jgi:hypothetical protein
MELIMIIISLMIQASGAIFINERYIKIIHLGEACIIKLFTTAINSIA